MSLALSPGWEEGRDETLFAGTETQGLYRSNDRGKSWIRLGASALQESIQSICLSPAFTEDEYLIVVAGGKVHLSVDGGENWNSLWDEITQDQLAAVVLVPDGMHAGQTALLGLADGRIIPTTFPGTEG